MEESPREPTLGIEDELPSLDVLTDLFERAKSEDEFEFICTLLRLRGMEDAGWDTLEESRLLMTQVISQTEAPIDELFRVRLFLFLYCHATEMYDLYHLVGNLLRVILGDRYSLNPFAAGTHGYKAAATKPTSKVARIQEWADQADIPEVGDLLKALLVSPVRNAFFHSDYVLYRGEFRIKRGQGVNQDGLVSKVVPLEWLLPRIELALNTVLGLVDLLQDHQASYDRPKILQGRFRADGGLMDMELIISEGYGVTGFRSPPTQPD